VSSGFCVEHPEAGLFYAADPEQILAAIYGSDYGVDGTAERRAEQRDAIALRAATLAQGLYALAACDAGEFDVDVETEDTLTAVFSDRSLPAPLIAWEWRRPELPLVLTSAAVELRAPRRFPARPAVEVIDSRSSVRLVYSLAGVGLFALAAM
jgi:hypothetical protein